MAQKGYWITCEDIYGGLKNSKEPDMCFGHVEGFHYTEAMGRSRCEVLDIMRHKLKDNIRFIYDCYNDLPPLARSDTPPDQKNETDKAYIFLALDEIDKSLKNIMLL